MITQNIYSIALTTQIDIRQRFNIKILIFLDAVQEKLLSDYEAELKTKKPTHAKKDSNASDDWEKLSNEGK